MFQNWQQLQALSCSLLQNKSTCILTDVTWGMHFASDARSLHMLWIQPMAVLSYAMSADIDECDYTPNKQI